MMRSWNSGAITASIWFVDGFLSRVILSPMAWVNFGGEATGSNSVGTFISPISAASKRIANPFHSKTLNPKLSDWRSHPAKTTFQKTSSTQNYCRFFGANSVPVDRGQFFAWPTKRPYRGNSKKTLAGNETALNTVTPSRVGDIPTMSLSPRHQRECHQSQG